MSKKKADLKTASLYYELSFPYSYFTKKGWQKIVDTVSPIADKVDILKDEKLGKSNKDPSKLGIMIHGIYFAEGMLDHEVNKVDAAIQELLTRIRLHAHIKKRKVFLV